MTFFQAFIVIFHSNTHQNSSFVELLPSSQQASFRTVSVQNLSPLPVELITPTMTFVHGPGFQRQSQVNLETQATVSQSDSMDHSCEPYLSKRPTSSDSWGSSGTSGSQGDESDENEEIEKDSSSTKRRRRREKRRKQKSESISASWWKPDVRLLPK